MHGVAPQMCGRVASPLLGRGAGGRSPGYLMSASPTSWPRSRWWPPELMSHPARSHHHRTRGEGDERNIKDAARNVKKSPAGAGLFTRGLSFTRKPGCSVANLDARPIPNAPIPIPNRGASGPIAWRPYIEGSGRNVDGRRLIVARAARDRRSKQCTNGQATNNAGGYLTAPCNRSAGCKRETKTACDQQTDQKLAHIGPLQMALSVREGLRQNYWRQDPTRSICRLFSGKILSLGRHHGSGGGKQYLRP
jgi:hypothetical protein